MMAEMDIQKILEVIPHRYPFLLVDRVLELDPGKSVVAIKNITINEPCFQGHFPGLPVYPGVLILESMAQTTGCLMYDDPEYGRDEGQMYFFAGVDKARFKRQVVPGDTLLIKTKVIKKMRGFIKLLSEAYVEDELTCSAEMMIALK